MKLHKILPHGATVALTTLLLAAAPDPAAAGVGTDPRLDRQVVGTRHTIVLPNFETEIAAGPGRDDYRAVCASCHSTRYVTLQPPLTERQWTESVDKMIKVHGAQIDAAQRQSVIGYLVATRSPGAVARAAAEEDDVAPAAVASPPSVVPVLAPATDPAERTAERVRGAELYRQWCEACHGPEGRGDGLLAATLFRKPENVAASRYSWEAVVRALWDGSPGTSMPSWRGMAASNLVALASHVQSLHRTPAGQPPAADSLRRGAEVFHQNCAPCHGVTGEGNGVNAASLYPRPANFTGKQPDRDFLLRVLETGVQGTGMPSWREPLSEADRAAVADHVRSLFRPGP